MTGSRGLELRPQRPLGGSAHCFASFYPCVRLLARQEFHGCAPMVPVVAVVFLGLALFVRGQGVRRNASTGS